MAEQIVFMNTVVQAGEKNFSGHSHLGELTILRTSRRDNKAGRYRVRLQFKRTGLASANTFVETRRAASPTAIGIAVRGGDGASPVSTFAFFNTQMQPFNEH